MMPKIIYSPTLRQVVNKYDLLFLKAGNDTLKHSVSYVNIVNVKID